MSSVLGLSSMSGALITHEQDSKIVETKDDVHGCYDWNKNSVFSPMILDLSYLLRCCLGALRAFGNGCSISYCRKHHCADRISSKPSLHELVW